MSTALDRVDRPQLVELELQLSQQLEQHRAAGLKLDLTRGKPGTEQLTLSDALDGILTGNYRDSAGTDLRNYGGLDGIPEAKVLFAEMMGVAPGEILIGGNSSLTLMYFAVVFALQQGVAGPGSAWAKEGGTIKFLAPVPGYDRHFSICQQLGIEMIPVALGDDGPEDSNIRIAPSFPSLEDIEQAMKVFVVCVKLASVRQRLAG